MVDEVTIWKSGTSSMTSAILGRVMNNLLTCKPKKLESAIVHLGDAPASTSPVTLEDSLWFLTKYVRDAAEQGESLDEVLIPLIENSLRLKDSKNISQAFVLLNWLFQDEVLFNALAKNLATVIQRKEDHYIALGWCSLVRGLVEFDSILKLQLKNDTGLRERHLALLKILCSSISSLSLFVCNGSVSRDGFELPTRLAAASADCILVLTEQLIKKPSNSTVRGQSASSVNQEPQKRISVVYGVHDHGETSPDVSNNIELGLQLWKNLDNLIVLLEKLQCWSRKSRPLHAEGSGGVLKWLKALKSHHGFYQDEPETGILLLSSCWKHYSMLLCLEDHQLLHRFTELTDQYLSGIEFYSEDGPKENEESIKETRNFFMNCLALLLGRLDDKRLSSLMADYGVRMSNVLLSQLHSADEELIMPVVCIFKLTIFKTTGSGNNLNHLGETETILSSLLKMLDKHGNASRAAVLLLAHHCSIHTNKKSFQEVLKYSTSGNICQRRNAIDFISELVRISACSDYMASDTKEHIAYHLLECLNDDESVIRNQAIKMLPLIDPSLVLPKVIRQIYASNSTISSAASNAFVAILKHHNEKFEVISLLLDSLSNLCQAHDQSVASTEERDFSTMDIDRIFKLIPEWSETVRNWDLLVGLLLDKMFSDPSNATIVKFLSCISDHLADASNIVLDRLLLQAKGQGDSKKYQTDDTENLQQMLFDHLCPLLIIKLLPLRIFNELTSSIMYGQYLCQDKGSDNFDINDYQCLAAYMLNRAFSQSEFQDVRKLAAELCGRIHPKVLYPVLLSQLESATKLKDTLRIKALLFTLCSSLVVRGKGAISHPTLIRIREILQTILLWSSVDDDEVAKAQHGCIDCLALMICAELQDSNNTSADLALEKSTGGKTNLTLVIKLLTEENPGSCLPADVSRSSSSQRLLSPLSYRLCMANVLISACQKIPDPCKKTFAQKTLHHLIQFFKHAKEEEIRAACTQVLFSSVYHLKLAVLPYVSALLDISLESLKEGSERERMAGAKLLASLMGSEDPIVGSISGRIYEIRSILAVISKSNASTDLKHAKNEETRAACTQVLFSSVYHLKLAVLPYVTALLDISPESLKEGSERERMAASFWGLLWEARIPFLEASQREYMRSILAYILKSNASTDLKLICQKMLVCLTS